MNNYEDKKFNLSRLGQTSLLLASLSLLPIISTTTANASPTPPKKSPVSSPTSSPKTTRRTSPTPLPSSSSSLPTTSGGLGTRPKTTSGNLGTRPRTDSTSSSGSENGATSGATGRRSRTSSTSSSGGKNTSGYIPPDDIYTGSDDPTPKPHPRVLDWVQDANVLMGYPKDHFPFTQHIDNPYKFVELVLDLIDSGVQDPYLLALKSLWYF